MDVLVVEDDATIAGPLTRGLEKAGFHTIHVATGSAALSAAPVDLVLLDLGLPDVDGLEVCRRLRARSDVPIIVVTARDDELDRVLGLEMGADDYVVKPFGVREVVARMRAVLRRVRPEGNGSSTHAAPVPGPEAADGSEAPTETTVSGLVVDRRARRVSLDGEEVALTPKEYDLLSLLAEDPGAAYRREDILEAVWDRNWFGPTKTIDVHVAALRRKLGDPGWIETIRGVGFRLGNPR